MTVIWIDILTPKQFWFFRQVGAALVKKGFKLTVTSRNYEQVIPLLAEFKHAEILVVGEYGGGDLRDKLLRSVERTLNLLGKIGEFDCAISGGSPEAARIAYGLGKPHLLTSDTPHSPVNRLVAPLSTRVLSPWIIGKTPWLKVGVLTDDIWGPSQLIQYKALDPVAWLKGYKPGKEALAVHGLQERGYVFVRSPEYKAAYLEKTRWSLESFKDVLKKLADAFKDLKVVVLPRYVDEVDYLKRDSNDSFIVVERPVKDLSLLYYSKLFIGGGGTMTQEAALLGIPTISFYPDRLPIVIKYLVDKGLVVHVRDFQTLVGEAVRLVKEFEEVKPRLENRAAKLLRSMEDPVEKVVKAVEEAVRPGG